MHETIFLKAKAKREDKKLTEVLDKFGMVHPHPSLGFFHFIYAPIEESNRNNVRLAEEAVEDAITQLRGTQANINHDRLGGCGSIIDAWVTENDEIEIVTSFFKTLYPKDYEKALELYEKGELFVSFELRVAKKDIELLADKTRRLHKVEFEGVGILLGENPAYPNARALEMAMQKIESMLNEDSPELVFANAKEISKHWTRIGELLEKTISEKQEEKTTSEEASYKCECLECGKVFTSKEHCKDTKCPECGGETRRKNRPGPGQKASDEKEKQDIESKGENKMDKKTNDALLAKLKKAVIDEFGEEAVKNWTDEDYNQKKIEAFRESLKKSKKEKDESKGSKEEKAENKDTEEKSKDKAEEKEEKVEKKDESAESEEKEEKADEEKPEEKKAEEKVEAKKSTTVTVEKLTTTMVYDDETREEKISRKGNRVVTQDGKKVVDEKIDTTIIYTYAQVEEIKAEYEKQIKAKDNELKKKDESIEAKDKEIKFIKENAKLIVKLRAELGDYVKALSDEDLVNQKDKVKIARLEKENAELKNPEEKKEKVEASEKKDKKEKLEAKDENNDTNELEEEKEDLVATLIKEKHAEKQRRKNRKNK